MRENKEKCEICNSNSWNEVYRGQINGGA